MRRSSITEGFGRIEEGLDRLETLAMINGSAELGRESSFEHSWVSLLHEMRAQLDGLEETVQSRVVQSKSMPAIDLLSKVVQHTISDCSENKMDPAFVLYAEGRISMDLVELSMASIMACLKVAVSSFKKQTSVSRMLSNLFPTSTFQMELRATSTDVQFKLLTDGDRTLFGANASNEAAIKAVRESVAKQGGWFSFKSLENYGGKIEFKIPVSQIRREALLLRSGSTEALLPEGCVEKVLSEISIEQFIYDKKRKIVLTADGALVCRVLAEEGIVPIAQNDVPALSGCKAVMAAVADFHILLVVDEVSPVARVREVIDQELIDKNSWFKVLGTYQQGAMPRLGPLVDGPVLMATWRKFGAEQ